MKLLKNFLISMGITTLGVGIGAFLAPVITIFAIQLAYLIGFLFWISYSYLFRNEE